MKIFIIKFGVAGLIIPIFITVIAYGSDFGKSGWSFKFFGFLWFSYFPAMGVGLLENIFEMFSFYITLVGLNGLYYALFGWFLWLGKTKSKWFYWLGVTIWLLVWEIIYIRFIASLLFN